LEELDSLQVLFLFFFSRLYNTYQEKLQIQIEDSDVKKIFDEYIIWAKEILIIEIKKLISGTPKLQLLLIATCYNEECDTNAYTFPEEVCMLLRYPIQPLFTMRYF
jgi:hypothetical protein